MKRFAICAFALLMMGGVATAQDAHMWIQAPGGGDNVTVGNGALDEAVIELWVEVYTMPYAGGRIVAIDSIMSGYDSAGTLGAENFEVKGFNDKGPWGTFGRRDPRGLILPGLPNGDIDLYQFVGLDENQPWHADTGLAPGTYHLDDLVIHGVTPTLAPDYVLFSALAEPGGFKVYPSYYTTGNYADLTVGFGTGNNAKGTLNDIPFFVNVTPEPTALSLLLLGGLAVFRRR